MAGAVPAGVPLEAAEAARATIGGAVALAEQLPDQLGAALVDAARAAFLQGLQLTAAISAAGAIGLAIFVAVVLRHVQTGSGPEGQPEAEANDPTPDLARVA
jgi:DHA2 family multidrug resistance protein-like MFS transporter